MSSVFMDQLIGIALVSSVATFLLGAVLAGYSGLTGRSLPASGSAAVIGFAFSVVCGYLAVSRGRPVELPKPSSSQPRDAPPPSPSPSLRPAPSEGSGIDWSVVIGALSGIVAVVAVVVVVFVVVRKVRAARAVRSLNERAWQELFDRHDEVKDAYVTHTFEDLDLVLDLPTLQDTSQSFVVDFLAAYDAAGALRPLRANTAVNPAGGEYQQAVSALSSAWSHALRQAKRLGYSKLSQADRRALQKAHQHWRAINDEATTPAERRLHAQQLQKCLDGLLDIGETPLAALEAASRGRLAR